MSPLIYTEIKGTIPDLTILFYGHYDKQPYTVADWDAPKHPYIPYRDPETDRLYGRGSADDGYSAYSSMLALKAVQQQGLPYPSTFRINYRNCDVNRRRRGKWKLY